MENVDQEIVAAVKLITSANQPEVQLAAIHKFFTPDAGFNHPLCAVASGPGSREQILGIYQWYRGMSPTIDLEVEGHTWNPETQTVYLNVVQKFQIFYNPFGSVPARLLVRLTIRRDPGTGLYQIAKQEDFYQPEDIAALMVPQLIPIIYLAKRGGAIASNLNAWLFKNVLGIWKPISTVGTRKA